MGYGTSQVLPVIVQSVSAPAGSLVIVEQPELHLHPTAQVGLTDLFLDSISRELLDRFTRWMQECEAVSRTNQPQPPRPNTDVSQSSIPYFLIETHSENILLRFQRRIVETSYFNKLSRCDEALLNLRESARQLPTRALGIAYVTRCQNTSRVEFMEADTMGNFVNASQDFLDFFSMDYTDALSISSTMTQIAALEADDEDRD